MTAVLGHGAGLVPRDRFLELTPDPVALVGTDGTVLDANPAWTRVLGWSRRELLDTRLLARVHEDDACRLDGAFDQTRATGAVDGVRARLQSRFGGYRWLEWTLRLLDDGSLYAAARDVTDQVRARDALLRHRDELESRITERTADLDRALARLQLHADNSPLATIEWDPVLRVVAWSRRARELFGWSVDEVLERAPGACPFLAGTDVGDFDRAMAPLVARERLRQVRLQSVRTRDGRDLTCQWFDSAVFDARGEVASILSLVQDVTEQHAVTRALQDSEERFRLAFEQTAVGMAHVSPDGRWLRVNRRLAAMLGHAEGASSTGRLLDAAHPDDREAEAGALARLLNGETDAARLDKRLLRADGSAFWAHQTISLRCDADGAPLHFIVVVEDISARVEAEQALRRAHEDLEAKVAERTRELERLMEVFEQQARQDPLTGLPNRRGLMDRLPRALERSGRQQGGVVVMFVDLDRFKHVNDTHGHEAGDALLRECASRLAAIVRKTDIVARLGGDEFVVVLENVRDTALQARRVAEKIRDALGAPVRIGDVAIAVSASIGVVVHEGDLATPEDLLARADGGMYAAKREGGNAVKLHPTPGALAPRGD